MQIFLASESIEIASMLSIFSIMVITYFVCTINFTPSLEGGGSIFEKN